MDSHGLIFEPEVPYDNVSTGSGLRIASNTSLDASMSSTIVPLTVACLLQAAQVNSLPPAALMTILKVEGGKVGKCVTHPNGRTDCGPMQVNLEVWLNELAEAHFKGNKQKAKVFLRDHGCYNAHVGAMILRQKVDEAGGDLYEGIGRYHSKTPHHKKKYQGLFMKNFKQLFGRYMTEDSAKKGG